MSHLSSPCLSPCLSLALESLWLSFTMPPSVWHSNPSSLLSTRCTAPLKSLVSLAHLTSFPALSYFHTLPSVCLPLLFPPFSCCVCVGGGGWGVGGGGHSYLMRDWAIVRRNSRPSQRQPRTGTRPPKTFSHQAACPCQIAWQEFCSDPEQSLWRWEAWHCPNPFRKWSVQSNAAEWKREEWEQRATCTYADTFRTWVTLWPGWALQQSKDSGEELLLSQRTQAQAHVTPT